MSTYAVINTKTGIVENIVSWDGESEWLPPDGTIAIPTDEGGIGWSYADGVFTEPPVTPPTPEEIRQQNIAVRDSLLAQATSAIAPLQDAVDLDDATAEETALLKKWKQYRVAVNRVDLDTQPATWPASPA